MKDRIVLLDMNKIASEIKEKVEKEFYGGLNTKEGENIDQIKLFNKFCENNKYAGTLKFNTIFGELYIQIRAYDIIIGHVTTIDEFENNTYKLLEKLQENILTAKLKQGKIELNL